MAALAAGRWPVVNVVNVVIWFQVDSHAMRPCGRVVNVGNVVNDFGLQNPRWKRESALSQVNLYCIYTQYINFKTYSRIGDYIDYKQPFPL